MPLKEALQQSIHQVRPMLSADHQEARRKVISLYKSWYRQIPLVMHEYDIPKSFEQCRSKLREKFLKHQAVSDVRVIDMLVVKGQMELKEVTARWKLKGHVMRYWNESQEPKPTDFLSKFYQGHD
ncbi:NADH dehydrogenase [ubiquinone] 1 alpha subcomplex subunit 6-like [Topomyia yanbarensis]|uniref:NADH dehydrogenase [ubiquinone] 1 alpha subcomplex subunit 6-like n=1 Tax=Topomyia yanbarensis TaxID=2498891 RepID=UPI00273BD1A7|nr:NADH dehydrogenase [ubiquinone] 1 alpha subcomplex subunit 6-like [Topomyia yanbarensis]